MLSAHHQQLSQFEQSFTVNYNAKRQNHREVIEYRQKRKASCFVTPCEATAQICLADVNTSFRKITTPPTKFSREVVWSSNPDARFRTATPDLHVVPRSCVVIPSAFRRKLLGRPLQSLKHWGTSLKVPSTTSEHWKRCCPSWLHAWFDSTGDRQGGKAQDVTHNTHSGLVIVIIIWICVSKRVSFSVPRSRWQSEADHPSSFPIVRLTHQYSSRISLWRR